MDDSNTSTPEIQVDFFPDKPPVGESKSSLTKSVGSLLLFIAGFYYFFDMDLISIFVLVVVLFIHEMGHFLAMKRFNYKDVKMFFIPLLGAMVMGEKQKISQKQNAIILLAGPVPGIVIGLVLFAIGYQTNNQSVILWGDMFIGINVFNLLPLTPLDGGNLIDTLFLNSKELVQTIFIILSIAGLVAITIALEVYILLVIPAFLLWRIVSIYRIKAIRESMDKDGINYRKSYEELSNEEYWKIREHVIFRVAAFKSVVARDYRISDREPQIVNNVRAVILNEPVPDLSILAKTLFAICWLLFLVGPIFIIGLIMYLNGAI
jgi:stage IV sporulation protein FB